MSVRKIISFRDTDAIIEYLDQKATQKGIDRSDVLRILIREKQVAEGETLKLKTRTQADSK